MDVEHLRHLARIEMDKKESERLAGDLEKILEFVDTLKEADVSGVSETTHAGEAKNVFRRDGGPDEFDEALVGRLISLFPEREKTYLKVKSVLKK